MKYSSNRTKALFGIILLILIILNFSLYLHLGYAFGGDQGLNNPSLPGLFNSLFIWLPNNYSGLVTPTTGILGLILSVLSLPYIIGIRFGYILSTSLYYWIGSFGMFLLVSEFKIKSSKNAFYGGIIASVIVSFAFFSHLKALSSPMIFLPYVVLFILLLLRQLNGKAETMYAYRKQAAYTSFLGIFIGLMIYTGGPSYILQNTIFLILLALVLILINQRSRVKFAKYMAIALILGFLINSSILVTTFIFTNNVGKQFFNSGSRITLDNVAMNFEGSLIAFGSGPSSNSLGFLLEIFIVLISVIGLLTYVVMNKKSLETRIALAFMVLYLFFIGLATTIYDPFKGLFLYALSKIPYLLVLRYPYFSLHYILNFLIAFFMGISFISLMDYAAKNHKNNFRKINLYSIFIILVFVITLVIYIHIFDITPVTTNSYQGIPAYVFNISNYINLQKGYFTVGLLPPAINWQIDNWYVGTNIYSALITTPVFTGGYTNYNEIFFPISKSEYFDIALSVGNSHLNNESLSNEFGIFGIHYIILQGDTLNRTPCEYCYATSFSKKEIKTNLLEAKNIKFLNIYGNSSLYENENYDNLVYGSDIFNLGNATFAELIDSIANENFSIQNTSVYSTDISGLYNDSNTINATLIRNFSQPNVSFVQNTPTSVTVHVTNATTPYYLVFRETYDPHWAAFYSNGTQVNPRDHIAVNGFANAWYMNKTGNYTITLYYTLQTDAWIAWGVSFAAFFVTVGIGVYGWRGMRHARGVK
ncbi:MAG: hypothetical protein QXF82_10975 [Nitrososphaeria archaeon]